MAKRLEYQEQLLGDSFYKILKLLGVSVGIQIPENGEKYTDAEWTGVRESLGKLLYQYLRDNPDKKDEFIAKINDPKNNGDGELSIGRGARKHLGEKLEKAYNNIASTPDETKEEEVSLKTDSHTETKPKEATEESAKEEKSEKDKEDEKKEPEKETVKKDIPTTTAELKKEEEPEPTHEDVDWIKQKRDFWKKYAGDIAHDFKEKEDAPKGTFEGTLYKDDKSQGDVRYTAPDRVEVSKDSELTTYQGVVKEIAQSGNTLTLGNSLNDKQKLMFYAAVLKEGSKVEIMNPPVLTKELIASAGLSADIQKILTGEYNRIEAQKEAEAKAKAEAEAKAKAEADAEAKAKAEIEKAAKERLKQIADEIKKVQTAVTKAATDKERLDLKKQELNLVKEKLAIDNEAGKKGVNVLSTDDRYQVRKDQSVLGQVVFDLSATDEQKQKRNEKEEDREAVREQIAAKMGIKTGVKDKDGNEIKKDEAYTKDRPTLFRLMSERYSSKGS